MYNMKRCEADNEAIEVVAVGESIFCPPSLMPLLI